jgi:signal transduction histidine kinase
MAAGQLLLEVRNLSEMTTAFLDFARPKTLNLSEVSLKELVEECVNELCPVFDEYNVESFVTGEFGITQADERMLKQTFLNLIRNAAEAIPAESPEKKVFIKGSFVTDKSGQQWAQVEITDTGKGVSEKDLPMIFVPFFTTKDKGHGIGLALSHRVISQHGGSLTASNLPNGGAVFTVKLKTT